MPISRIPPAEMAKLRVRDRVKSLRIWFLILAILGLLAMLYVGYKAVFSEPKPTDTRQTFSLISTLIPTAYAQGTEQPKERSSSGISGEMKQNVMVGIIAVLALVMLVSLAAVLFAKDAARIAQAGDILKTVLGFFIGVATTFFGS
jgi:Ca2+/Na+ antiporter